MAKKRKAVSQSASFLDTTLLKSFFDSPMGRQLLADIVLAAAGAAAAALLASNKGKKAMGKAAMDSAQTAVMGVLASAAQNFSNGKATGRRSVRAR